MSLTLTLSLIVDATRFDPIIIGHAKNKCDDINKAKTRAVRSRHHICAQQSAEKDRGSKKRDASFKTKSKEEISYFALES